MALQVSGTTVVDNSRNATNINRVEVADGTVSAPSITNTGDTNTGIYFPADDQIGLATAGTVRVRVTAGGDLAFGSSLPTNVAGWVTIVVDQTNGSDLIMRKNGTDIGGFYTSSGNDFSVSAYGTSDLLFRTNNTTRMTIDDSGNVGVGTSPTTSALVALSSTTRGFLPPRMTTTQRNAIASAATGLLIYNTTTNRLEIYTGSAWVAAGSGVAGGGTDQIFWENGQTITSDYTITSGRNAMTAGPVTINSGITVTIPSGSAWTIVGV